MLRHLLSREGQKRGRAVLVDLPQADHQRQTECSAETRDRELIRAFEALETAGHTDDLLEALAKIHRLAPEKAGEGDLFRSPSTGPVEEFIATGRLPGEQYRQTA